MVSETLGKKATYSSIVPYRDHNVGPRSYSKCTVRAQDYFWIKSQQSKPLWYRLASRAIIGCTTGLLRTIIGLGLVKTTVVNREAFVSIITDPKRIAPVLTFSNHISTFDDPAIWGVLPKTITQNPEYMRWTLAFFSMGQVIPTIRGAGIYQSAVDLAISLLGYNKWVHIFPEGYVNQNGTIDRFKWGISRIILESDSVPIIIPIFHAGLDEVFPLTNKHRYPVLFSEEKKHIYIEFGNPIDLSKTLDEYNYIKKERLDIDKNELDIKFRIMITQRLSEELEKLKINYESAK
ncbi:hypothetical protein BB561_003797 [Smittium simulii]|uniref:Tafazzin family protein n=1 Tax=Smittium simulii TaxID=133385 RepID=A0A2T9YJH7_9FUNG|nr:hypothetical protein BB561_003797 [Smittium simulii]